MRGKRERESLKRVKDYLFCHKEKQLDLLMSPYYYEINDNDVLENIQTYILLRRDCYYGVIFEDIEELFESLLAAKENPEKSKFPDFILDDGWIEHFKITSSKETSKGSIKEISSSKFERDTFEDEVAFKKHCEENAVPDFEDSKEWQQEDVQHSYNMFQYSMNKQISHHIDSANKYSGNKEIKIFLIEYDDVGLEMIEEFEEKDFKNGNSPQHYWNYKLSKDKEMLKYLYNLKDKVDYVIFENHEDVEIIKILNIPQIISQIRYNHKICGRRNLIIKRTCFVCKKIGF